MLAAGILPVLGNAFEKYVRAFSIPRPFNHQFDLYVNLPRKFGSRGGEYVGESVRLNIGFSFFSQSTYSPNPMQSSQTNSLFSSLGFGQI